MAKKYEICLTEEERRELEEIVGKNRAVRATEGLGSRF